MPLIQVVITLIVVGVLLWLEETYIPLAQPIKTIIRAVVVIVVVLWLLPKPQAVGCSINSGAGSSRNTRALISNSVENRLSGAFKRI